MSLQFVKFVLHLEFFLCLAKPFILPIDQLNEGTFLIESAIQWFDLDFGLCCQVEIVVSIFLLCFYFIELAEVFVFLFFYHLLVYLLSFLFLAEVVLHLLLVHFTHLHIEFLTIYLLATGLLPADLLLLFEVGLFDDPGNFTPVFLIQISITRHLYIYSIIYIDIMGAHMLILLEYSP